MKSFFAVGTGDTAVARTSRLEACTTVPGQLFQSIINLRRNRAQWDGLCQRVFPEVTHQAAPGTFAIGQENRRHRHNLSRLRTLFFDEEGMGFEGIELVPHAASRENPAVPVRDRLSIKVIQSPNVS